MLVLVLESEDPLHHHRKPRIGPSQQRRRARRAEARTAAVEAVDHAEKADTEKVIDKPSAEKAFDGTEGNGAVQASSNAAAKYLGGKDVDELCSDAEYAMTEEIPKIQKTYCIVEIYPYDTVGNIENFKESVENYFKKFLW